MRQYDSCFKYAKLALELRQDLLDYNNVSAGSTYPFGRFSQEVIMHSSIQPGYSTIENNYARVDSVLFRSYSDQDLRKTLFYRGYGDGTYYFRGSYARRPPFNGIAVNELYLEAAECAARLGDKTTALSYLNALLEKRFKKGSFTAYTANDATATLQLILAERRKELVYHGLRWMDIKRLNKEGANITLSRIVNGQLRSLAPGANRYALPIPPDIIALTGMVQNPE